MWKMTIVRRVQVGIRRALALNVSITEMIMCDAKDATVIEIANPDFIGLCICYMS